MAEKEGMDKESTIAVSNSSAFEWPPDPSCYELIGKIGQGAFATVWRANAPEERECAIKVLNLDHVDTNLAEIRLEVQAMRLSLHPNILTCYAAFVNETNLWLLTPLMSKGSSLHCLQRARRILRDRNEVAKMEEHILYILHETLLGLQYIHENGQIHRDIKAGNVLLDGNGDVRIADFGVSGWLVQGGAQQEKAKTFVGTPCWMAPEVMEQVHGYDYKADIWSFGITALELAKGYAPYAKYPPMKVLILTIQEDPPSLESYIDDDDDDLACFEEYSRTFRTLVQLCLHKNPAKRPTCQELLNGKILSFMNDPAVRQIKRETIRSQVCDIVPDVGSRSSSSSPSNRQMPGNAPISIVLSKEVDRPPGTTWVFPDGSQVLSSSMTPVSVDDVLEELDEFGKQTGGEHYRSKSAEELAKNSGVDNVQDDLDAFMDEFEQNTAGEDFRRP
ncbi:serine/threonine-protein kinase OSR1/STK39 [Fistulifera solaris]|uniref:Serine/threonine-protein kinase OSR1/STK39 n=1 Tax=Fistulifera solaris TaxID=1519565 RepID=A0A1Z5KBS0_FISSO|nr:serine/threonine-protein kinase OSR1/STK39 [Fistulifera solaris]|eukprot:GAX23646.1 serine/threonine-protein kinase OSR1/STK39 [Fistulifera solaris]